MRKKALPRKAHRCALCVDAGEYEVVDVVRRKVYEICPILTRSGTV